MSSHLSKSERGSHKSSSSKSGSRSKSSSASKPGKSTGTKNSSQSKETAESVFKDFGGAWKFQRTHGINPRNDDAKAEARNMAQAYADASNQAKGK